MHNKKNISIVVLILLMGVGVWYFYPLSEHVAESEQQVIEKEPVSQQVKKEEKKPIAQSIGDYLAKPAQADPAIIKRIQKIRKFQDLKTGEFNYFGKVIDQHGEPVVGATVKVDIGYYPLIPNGNFYPSHKIKRLTTDAEGKFSIVGEKGESVRIQSINKDGYELKKYRRITFSRVGIEGLKKFSNPDKPVIFHAWKKTEAEALVHDILEVGYRPDGKFYRVSLKGVEEQLKISFIADPKGNRSKPLDWSMELKVIDGGIIESTDGFMNEAPLEGYLPILSYQYKKGDKGFSNDIRKKFYIKARNGQVYGRLECRIHPYYGRDNIVAFDVKYWVNPNGSRNLQYDPKKRIYPK